MVCVHFPSCVDTFVTIRGTNDIQISCRQQPTLGFGSKGFNLRVIFSLPLSISHTLSLSFPNGTLFCQRHQWKLSIREQGRREEGSQRQLREEAPSKDSIRRDQIKLLASSAPGADKLTACPIWASGTVRVGTWGVLRSQRPAAPPPLGTPDTNSDSNIERYSLTVLSVRRISFNMDVIFAA